MRVSLKSKLTALISFLVLVVVLATATAFLGVLTRQALQEVKSKGEFVANTTYQQARTALAGARLPAGLDPNNPQDLRRFIGEKLAEDSGVTTSLQSAAGYLPTVDYVAITDTELVVMAHSDPTQIGTRFAPAEPFENLLDAGLIRQLRVIYGPGQVYEFTLRFDMGGKPLGDVRVGVSTIFLRDQLTPELRSALWLALLAVVLATVTAGLLSFRLLRPLETISKGVDRMARGEYGLKLEVRRADEWGILSSRLNLLGEQMQGEKAAYVALKERLDQLFSNLADGLMLFDKDDRLALATPSVERFLRRSPENLLHGTAPEIFAGDAPLDSSLREAFKNRQPLSWQTFEPSNGSEEPRLAVNVQFVEERGERLGALVTLRDTTIRAELEDQLDVATRLAAIGRLTSGVAHEVKNPLNAMILQVEILKSKLAAESHTVEPQLEILSSEIRRLDRVVKTFLDFTRPVELRFVSTDIAALVREVVSLAEPQAKQNNVRLVIEPDGATATARVDRDLMKQALLNLVLNGCQAMPSGGELRVRVQPQPGRLELEIADQGTGIPEAIRPRIFTLFYTTKPGGTGVGLAMTSRIVQLHNGSIDFASEENRGTTFRVVLPR
jgi:signal transduction histidine kinase